MLSTKSRYYKIDTTEFVTTDGKQVMYLLRRFLPNPADTALLIEHTVKQGERLDNITARYFGDPEQFWQVCDANDSCLNPDDLINVGRRVRINMPQRG